MRDLQKDWNVLYGIIDWIAIPKQQIVKEWLERAIKAEAENALLRKVASIAWNVVETRGMSDVLLNELAGRLADWETWKEGTE